MPVMRAKMQLSTVTKHETIEILKFHAVAAKTYCTDGLDEDNTFAKFSPIASLEITVANPALLGKLEPGQKYYVDFTEAD